MNKTPISSSVSGFKILAAIFLINQVFRKANAFRAETGGACGAYGGGKRGVQGFGGET